MAGEEATADTEVEEDVLEASPFWMVKRHPIPKHSRHWSDVSRNAPIVRTSIGISIFDSSPDRPKSAKVTL